MLLVLVIRYLMGGLCLFMVNLTVDSLAPVIVIQSVLRVKMPDE